MKGAQQSASEQHERRLRGLHPRARQSLSGIPSATPAACPDVRRAATLVSQSHRSRVHRGPVEGMSGRLRELQIGTYRI